MIIIIVFIHCKDEDDDEDEIADDDRLITGGTLDDRPVSGIGGNSFCHCLCKDKLVNEFKNLKIKFLRLDVYLKKR